MGNGRGGVLAVARMIDWMKMALPPRGRCTGCSRYRIRDG